MSTVRIVCTQGDHPILVNGTLTTGPIGQLTVDCGDGAEALAVGAKVVVTVEAAAENQRCIVASVEPGSGGRTRLVLENEAVHSSDKRDYPRLFAGLPIRFRSVSEAEATAWAAGDPIGGHWSEPDPYMNFSVGGLRFDCAEPLVEGGVLAIELSIGDGATLWRVTARVVRVFEAMGDRPASVAVSFDHLPDGARDALTALTLQIQESLL